MLEIKNTRKNSNKLLWLIHNLKILIEKKLTPNLNLQPDINAGNKKYEEKLKLITLAYTQLKNTYREKIDTKS